MSTARYLVGDVFDQLATLPDGSVDLVMTSPPFLALRSYLPAGHPDKAREIGSEATPAEFVDTLLRLTAEWRRVLAPHGSIVVELGDTYSGSGGAGGDYNPGGLRDGQAKFKAGKLATYTDARGNTRTGGGRGWPLAKSLVGIPHLYHLSLAYGRNLLTGEPSPAGSWRVRNVVAWCRPNPPVGALGDKFRPATSYLTVACVSGKRYFDLDAVRTPGPSMDRTGEKRGAGYAAKAGTDGISGFSRDCQTITNHPAGAPPLDWWEIPTHPYPGAHYATYPEALVVRPIESMCPRKVCRTCGEPSRRIVEAGYLDGDGNPAAAETYVSGVANGKGAHSDKGPARLVAAPSTIGWTSCGHDDWRPGVVLDPFAGSGTTLAVATARSRDAIGIDLDARNLDLARERIGMWLVEDAA